MTTETTMSQRVSEERVFRALSDSHRRELLDLLHAQDGRTLSELDSHLPMTRFGTMKHLRMLESAGLVITRRAGRKKLHYLNAEPIRRAYLHWIRKYAEADPRDPDSLPEGSASPGGARAALQHVYEVLVRTSPAKLWEAITSPEFTPGYFFGTRVSSEWRPGARLTYAYPDGRLAAEGTVLEVNPPLVLGAVGRAGRGRPGTPRDLEARADGPGVPGGDGEHRLRGRYGDVPLPQRGDQRDPERAEDPARDRGAAADRRLSSRRT